MSELTNPRALVFLALGLVGCAPTSQHVRPPVEIERPAVAEVDVGALDALLAAHARSDATVGLSAAIVHGDRLLLAKGYGNRSREDDLPVENDTLFAIGSVTKQFTCACVLLLAEDGALAVDDPVSKWYPDLTRAGDITLLDLMNHTSGYPDYYPLDYVDRRMSQPIDPDELLRQYAGGELDFEPGTNWSYSNTGYILLGRVVEKVSGESFGAFLARRIFEPLEMTNTLFEPDPDDPRCARGYETFALGPPEPNHPEASGWIYAAGGIWSTAGDLVKWNRAIIDGELLSPQSWALMRTERTLRDGRRSGYGGGLSVRTQSGREYLRHGGAVDGFNAFSGVVPSTGTSVTLLCNQNGGVGDLPGKIMDLLFDVEEIVPEVAGPPPVEVVREVFAAMQRGEVDRAELTRDFDEFLTEQRLAGAAERLAPFGAPEKVELLGTRERGGMEVTTTRLRFADGALRVLMYREPDGRIAEFFVVRD